MVSRNMGRKTQAGLIGAIVVVAILALQSIEHWTVIDAVLAGLRNKGAAGAFIAGFLISPVVPLAIAIAAIYLVLEGTRDKSGDRQEMQSPPAESKAVIQGSGNSSATGGNATATIGDIHIHPPAPAPLTALPREEAPLPMLEFVSCKSMLVYGDFLRVEDVGSTVLLAEFRNMLLGLGLKTPTAYRVLAQLTFRFDKHQAVSVPYGKWANNYTHFAQFDPGKSMYLVVALCSTGKQPYTLQNNNSFDPRLRRIRAGVTILHAPGMGVHA